jgi:hypothetical protein
MPDALRERCQELETAHGPVVMGPMAGQAWRDDPKHLLFTLARYKFVAKMLKGYGAVAEIGAGDGFFSSLVEREVGDLYLYDCVGSSRVVQHNIMTAPVWRSVPQHRYDALYALDVFEHVADGRQFFRHAAMSLRPHGVAIVGTPSLESQRYASPMSRAAHINCVTGDVLRGLALEAFHHVFMFSMNDEVVHTGFLPMAHYLIALCCEVRNR